MANMLLNSRGYRAETCSYGCCVPDSPGHKPGKKGKRPLKHSIKRAETRDWKKDYQ